MSNWVAAAAWTAFSFWRLHYRTAADCKWWTQINAGASCTCINMPIMELFIAYIMYAFSAATLYFYHVRNADAERFSAVLGLLMTTVFLQKLIDATRFGARLPWLASVIAFIHLGSSISLLVLLGLDDALPMGLHIPPTAWAFQETFFVTVTACVMCGGRAEPRSQSTVAYEAVGQTETSSPQGMPLKVYNSR